jgi:hypothetical protein
MSEIVIVGGFVTFIVNTYHRLPCPDVGTLYVLIKPWEEYIWTWAFNCVMGGIPR